MSRLTIPQLSAGNLCSLMDAVRDLHRQAGRPSTRQIADGLNFTHDTVHRLLTKTLRQAPKWQVLRDVVRKLGAEAPGCDVEAEVMRIHALWVRADEQPFPAPDGTNGPVRVDDEDAVPDRPNTSASRIGVPLSPTTEPTLSVRSTDAFAYRGLVWIDADRDVLAELRDAIRALPVVVAAGQILPAIGRFAMRVYVRPDVEQTAFAEMLQVAEKYPLRSPIPAQFAVPENLLYPASFIFSLVRHELPVDEIAALTASAPHEVEAFIREVARTLVIQDSRDVASELAILGVIARTDGKAPVDDPESMVSDPTGGRGPG